MRNKSLGAETLRCNASDGHAAEMGHEGYCVYRKLKLGHNGDAVRQGSRGNGYFQLVELGARKARPNLASDAFAIHYNRRHTRLESDAVRGNFMSVNFFPSGAPYHARDWPFSDISCVSRANRSELIPCIRLQIREIALTAPNPQRWARRFFRSALILTRHATTAPCRG